MDTNSVHTNRAVDIQPETIEFYSADGVFVKTMHIRYKGVIVPQHSHQYDHMSFLAIGEVSVFKHDKSGSFTGERMIAPCAIHIKAGIKHSFLSVTDEVLILCIHNVSRTGEVEILEEHHLGDSHAF